jgi:predicted TIM-barrel fold metal-dependent hydrolase
MVLIIFQDQKRESLILEEEKMSDEIIDIHVHFGAPEGEGSPCYWSKEFEASVAYFAMLVVTGSLFKKVNIHQVKKHMLKVINKSKFVNKSVLLAMDCVYDHDGNPQKNLTHLYTPNRYIAKLAKENERVLFGASVHPYRANWEEELDFCLDNGAVLCKWIPSSMMLDPSHTKCEPFYKKLAESKLPLLCHCGPEHAIPTSNPDYNKYNSPKLLKTALDMGVTVIVAHCAMPFWGEAEDDTAFEELRHMFDEADGNNWNLYADISALCVPMRAPYIKKAREQFPLDRLVFGSDHPIPITEFSYNASSNLFIRLRLFLKAFFIKNLLDKNYRLLKGMEFGDAAYSNAARILRL